MNKTRGLLFTAGIVLATAFTFSGCKEDNPFTDSRDSKAYKTVKIGKQVWMAENLNYAAEGSLCYGEGGGVIIGWEGADGAEPVTKKLSSSEAQAYCEKYGRLYTWEAAMKACPAGWHLPSDAEWQTLVDFAGGNETAGAKLKAMSGWNPNEYENITGNGTDDYGFSALPGGYGSSGCDDSAGWQGFWWSATENNADYAYNRLMYYRDEDVSRRDGVKSSLFSVRCVRD